jgi:hypothetical protein
MNAKRPMPLQTIAFFLGTAALLLGVGLVLSSLMRGQGLHGGGLVASMIGLLVISSSRRRTPTDSRAQPPI